MHAKCIDTTRGVGHKGGMREHPLLMKGPLVRATLEGRKTQTRRPLRNQPPSGYHLVRVCGPWAEFENDAPTLAKYSTKSPLGETGDRLWVRETWTAAMYDAKSPADCLYRADDNRGVEDLGEAKWTPSIHMPRWACRLVLPLVSVRVERVQDITEEDAKAEGVEPVEGSYREGFRVVWQLLYGTWDLNPWVWVAEWKDIEART